MIYAILGAAWAFYACMGIAQNWQWVVSLIEEEQCG